MHVVFAAPLTWDTLCKRQFPLSPTDWFCRLARCEMGGGLLVLVKKKKKEVDWGDGVEKKGVLHYVLSSQVAICPSSTVPVEQSCVGWRGDDQRPTESSSSSSSILQHTAASGSITLTTPVTEPHAAEQCPLPDSANYSDPLRGNKRSFNRWENRGVFIRLFGERGDEYYIRCDTDGSFCASGLKRLCKVLQKDQVKVLWYNLILCLTEVYPNHVEYH